MYSRSILSMILFLASAHVLAQQDGSGIKGSIGEVALSNDTLELRYIGTGKEVGVGSSSHFSGAFFLSESRDIVFSAALMFPADFDLGRLSLWFGPQVYAALLEDENNDVLSMTLGAEARFLIEERRGLAIVGKAFFGPDILTFGSADKLTDLSARVEMRLAERANVFAGMRWFEFDLTEGGGTETLQEEAFVGIGYRF